MASKVNNRKIVYPGKVFTLVKENVTLENGTTTDVEFIEHPGAVAVIPFIDDTRVVLLKQYRHALKGFIWEIPAGTLGPQETITNCAKRELIEETGYSADRWHRLGEITLAPGCSDEHIHIFLATELQPARQNLDDDEVIQVQEVEFLQAIEMIVSGEIQDAKSIAGLFLASQWQNSNAQHFRY